MQPVPSAAPLPQSTAHTVRKRLQNWLIGLDQFLFVTLTLGAAYPDETASSAAWRMERMGKWQGRWLRPCIDAIFSPWQKNHCQTAYEGELMGRQLPLDQRYAASHPAAQQQEPLSHD